MTAEEQRVRRGARRRRKLLSFLSISSCCLNIAALACIILVAIAGTNVTAWDSQGPGYFDHPGDESLEYREFALVQLTTNISNSSPTLYWFLNGFGWVYFYGGEEDSAGWVYRAAGQTLQFPTIMNDFLHEYNYTIGATMWDDCEYHNTTQPDGTHYICTWKYDNSTIAAFDAAPKLSVPTAPAFVFYILVAALAVALLPIEWIRWTWGEDYWASSLDQHRTCGLVMQERHILTAYAVAPGAHLIAAAYVTGAAVTVRNYLSNTPELSGLAWNISLGTGLLKLVWLGFLGTTLGSIARVSRWWLKRRWKIMLEWENVLTLADVRRRADRQPGLSTSVVERARSEQSPVPSQVPRCDGMNPSVTVTKATQADEKATITAAADDKALER